MNLTHLLRLRRLKAARRRAAARPGRVLGWAAAGFVAIQLVVGAAIELARPDLRDPEFGPRLTALLREQQRQPRRVEIVALGSSRVLNGFRPATLGLPEDRAFALNMAQVGNGPIEVWIRYQRLRLSGVRPDRLLIEVLPAHLADEASSIARLNPPASLTWQELEVVRPYVSQPERLRTDWAAARAVPLYFSRTEILTRYTPEWQQLARRRDGYRLAAAKGGWFPGPVALSPQQQAAGLEKARAEYAGLLADLHIAPLADQALRLLLERCRNDGVEAALLLMPESSVFRSWYGAKSKERLNDYLAGIGRDYGVPLIDARTWLADDAFADGHHLLTGGADTFTLRLEREAADFFRVVP